MARRVINAVYHRALVASLLLVVFIVAGCGGSAPAQHAGATATPSPVPTRAAIPGFPLPSWQAGGPPFATAIAFAPGQASVAYACGASGAEASPGIHPIVVAVSSDGARTWTTEATPAQSQLCSLSVDPTDARDVALFTTTCVQNCADDPVTHLYRSRDMGHSWSELVVPPLPPVSNASAPAFTDMLVWSGTMLIAETQANIPGGHPVYHLLASANTGPLARIDQAAIFKDAAIGGAFTLGLAIYVRLFPTGCAAAYFCSLVKSTDDGASWQQVTLRYQNQPVDLLASSSTSMIVGTPGGAVEHAQIARTSDDGLSWQALPAKPAGLAYYAVADGTLFVIGLDSGALYQLAPGAQQWQEVIPSPVPLPTGLDDGSLVFQLDAAGHPIAVWRDAGQDQNNNAAQYPGLQYHSL